jgi:hypothetical protein
MSLNIKLLKYTKKVPRTVLYVCNNNIKKNKNNGNSNNNNNKSETIVHCNVWMRSCIISKSQILSKIWLIWTLNMIFILSQIIYFLKYFCYFFGWGKKILDLKNLIHPIMIIFSPSEKIGFFFKKNIKFG